MKQIEALVADDTLIVSGTRTYTPEELYRRRCLQFYAGVCAFAFLVAVAFVVFMSVTAQDVEDLEHVPVLLESQGR